ncbi:MAG: hypothetical protein JWN29_2425 [Acidimicrobiales bacterium]|nr:hypothetical protein [Acidimicrobiales bacterium]
MRRIWGILGVLALGLVGCGDGDGSSGGTVGATLSDFKISLDTSSVPAGDVTFEVANKGPSVHEFVVFKTDLAPEALPRDDSGEVAESDEFAPIDEIEDIQNGAQPKLDVNLEAGTYVIICNVPAHYGRGMHAALQVL